MYNCEVEQFLDCLANSRKVSASAQSQELYALVFMSNHALNSGLKDLKNGYAKKPVRVPQIISHKDAMTLISLVQGKYQLVAS